MFTEAFRDQQPMQEAIIREVAAWPEEFFAPEVEAGDLSDERRPVGRDEVAELSAGMLAPSKRERRD